jgi:hypothetical protein
MVVPKQYNLLMAWNPEKSHPEPKNALFYKTLNGAGV